MFYLYWIKEQKLKEIKFGISNNNTILMDKNNDNEANLISSIFSIKFSLENSFNKLMNYFTSYSVLIIMVKINQIFKILKFILEYFINFYYGFI